MNKLKTVLFLTYSLFIITSATYGQANINSPYSRYGIGDLQFSGFARNLGMGGLGISITSPYNLNFTNPASYASLAFTTFEGGIRGNNTELQSSDIQSTSSSASFGYFAFGFPLKANKWGLSFGLLPYSNVGYNITDIEHDNELGDITYNYQGKGGINQFYVGTGYSLLKNLRVGANVSYLFGTINQIRSVTLPYSIDYFNTRITDKTSVGDFHFNLGMQFTLDSLKISPSDSVKIIRRHIAGIHAQIDILEDSLARFQKTYAVTDDKRTVKTAMLLLQDSIAVLQKQIDDQNEIKKHIDRKKARGDWSLNFGATLSLSSNINASRSSVTELFVNPSSESNVVLIKDTAQNIQNQKGVIKLPLALGFGVAIKKGTKWLVGADVTAQDWTDYRSFGGSDSLVNSVLFSLGAQYIPGDRSIRSYWDIIQYRVGFHYSQTYLQLKSSQLNDYGVSVGFGFPMKRSLSIIQFAIELGKMGTTANNLIQENYVRFTLGLTLGDIWFLKPRID